LLVTEAGGAISDVNGNKLDFSVGRTLAKNKGVIASNASIHDQVLKAVQTVLAKKQ
jgi:3'(2'), 5'-bisphosphate nucleotidase